MKRRSTRARHQRGQSIVEYLMITAGLIAGIIIIKNTIITPRMTGLRSASEAKLDTAKTTAGMIDGKNH